ncbi:MAG: glycosyltransferase [Leptolyngbyaceae cyanobacterium CSU_1_3]|nr:glycosyltransferase [Leptolyngbyaceae cyanobacterium CSU_1_3]
MSPKITIGISFRNPGHYFTLALQSVFAQTFTDWELILIDDGSSDDSLTIALSLQDPRVRVYCDQESRGLNIRLNQLVQMAKAPYFLRMDADDVMHPQRLEKQYQQLIQHDRNTVIGSAAYSINAASQVTGLRLTCSQQKSGFSARHSFIHPTVAASIEWFQRNPYSEDFIFQRSQDAELWCRTTDHTLFVNLSEPLLYYREGGTFSFSNYLGTSLGLLSLIYTHYSFSHLRFFYLFLVEMIKLAIVCIADRLQMTEYLVSRRYRSLSSERLQPAIVALSIVKQQPLPLG